MDDRRGGERAPTLVLGVGNLLQGDDGLGVQALGPIAARELPPGVEVADGGTAGLDLLNLVADRDLLVVVDVIQAPEPPGTLLRLEAEALADTRDGDHSLHRLGIREVLEAAAMVDAAPREVVFLGLVPSSLATGTELSPPVAAALPRLVDRVLAELEERRPRR